MNNNLLLNFLLDLDSFNIPYVSWKNNHELGKAMLGKTDIDLYVPIKYRKSTIDRLVNSNWMEVQNPVASFPSVFHFYHVNSEGSALHIHLYFEIITGESWIKEFILPIGDFLIEQRVRSKEFKVWILNDKAQAYLFMLRHIIKGGSFFSRALYKKELESYKIEWQSCSQNIELLYDYGPIKLNQIIINSGLHSAFKLPFMVSSILFRIQIKSFLRLNLFLLPCHRLFSLLKRSMNKLFYKQKKILLGKGMVIAISGVDGSGKSTMIEMSYKCLSQFLSVDKLTIGRPQGKIIELLRQILDRKNHGKHSESNQKYASSTGFFKSLKSIFLAMLRLRMAIKSQSYIKKGHIVLVDRWPTTELGCMDGPKIICDESDNILIKLCFSLERWLYDHMPKADVCFFLQVSAKTAIYRNSERIKIDKETTEEIISRYSANHHIQPVSKKNILFDNNGLYEEKRQELLMNLWKEILHHNLYSNHDRVT